jgi:NAD(P)-dependent dehydrogenase (short-subunit alcohol dehydrogenase family)
MHLFTGHFYLTKLLLPALKAAVKRSPAGTVRVVNTSSIAHYMSPKEGIRWSTLLPGPDAAEARKKLGVAKLFGQSKLVKWHNPRVTV